MCLYVYIYMYLYSSYMFLNVLVAREANAPLMLYASIWVRWLRNVFASCCVRGSSLAARHGSLETATAAKPTVPTSSVAAETEAATRKCKERR
jgi:hypothetical protein